MAIPTTCPSPPPASTSTLPSLLRGGCMIVDSTRKGKRFPDSMSKTIPIWTCVLNRAIFNFRTRLEKHNPLEKEPTHSNGCRITGQDSSCWDCSLHLPIWVSKTEKSMIESRLESWTNDLEASGADIAAIALSLRKPLRPLWISQKTVIWLNEVPYYDSWDFTPIILISASSSSGTFQHRTSSEFSWNYISGAGDDEESWARGLSPDLFWKHSNDLISSGPDLCNQNVANIVETDRVRRAQKGEYAPQVSVRHMKCPGETITPPITLPLDFENGNGTGYDKLRDDNGVTFLGSTSIAVGKSQHTETFFKGTEVPSSYCVLYCGYKSAATPLPNPEMHLHLPIVDSKFDRTSLPKNLPTALNFARKHLRNGKTLLVCCSNGEDISICVCLAILTFLYDETGQFDDGKHFNETKISKLELRKRLVFICKYAVNARPSRGNLKQVFACLSGGSMSGCFTSNLRENVSLIELEKRSVVQTT